MAIVNSEPTGIRFNYWARIKHRPKLVPVHIEASNNHFVTVTEIVEYEGPTGPTSRYKHEDIEFVRALDDKEYCNFMHASL